MKWNASQRADLVNTCLDMQRQGKSQKVVWDFLKEQGCNAHQARRVLDEAAELWGMLGDADPKRVRHLDRLLTLFEQVKADGNLSAATKLLVEVGKVEGLTLASGSQAAPEASQAEASDLAAFEALKARHKV